MTEDLRGRLHSCRSLAPRAFAALFCLSALVSCSDDVTGSSDLQGGEWRLRSLQGPDFAVATVEDPRRFTLDFAEGGRLNVRADCNRCGGTYSMDGSSLRISALVCTRVFCPSAPLDTRYVEALEQARSVDRDDQTLRITSQAYRLVFTR